MRMMTARTAAKGRGECSARPAYQTSPEASAILSDCTASGRRNRGGSASRQARWRSRLRTWRARPPSRFSGRSSAGMLGPPLEPGRGATASLAPGRGPSPTLAGPGRGRARAGRTDPGCERREVGASAATAPATGRFAPHAPDRNVVPEVSVPPRPARRCHRAPELADLRPELSWRLCPPAHPRSAARRPGPDSHLLPLDARPPGLGRRPDPTLDVERRAHR
jgi:hypothetical protein